MSKDGNGLPGNEKEEQSTTLTKLLDLAPLLAVILQYLELILNYYIILKRFFKIGPPLRVFSQTLK